MSVRLGPRGQRCNIPYPHPHARSTPAAEKTGNKVGKFCVWVMGYLSLLMCRKFHCWGRAVCRTASVTRVAKRAYNSPTISGRGICWTWNKGNITGVRWCRVLVWWMFLCAVLAKCFFFVFFFYERRGSCPSHTPCALCPFPPDKARIVPILKGNVGFVWYVS